MARRRSKAGYVHFYRKNAESPKREKAEFGYDNDGNKIVHLPPDSQVQCNDMLKVALRHPAYMYVFDVESDKKETRAKVLLCQGAVTVKRIGRYRYFLDNEKDAFLNVCVREVVWYPRSRWFYNWDTKKLEGQAEFLMWKCDVRPLDRLVYSWLKPDPFPDKKHFSCIWNVGCVTKQYHYQVDSVEDSKYEGLLRVLASADNRDSLLEVGEKWQDTKALGNGNSEKNCLKS